MLQTCTRCRARRSKCDTLLPACAHCAKNDLECTFRDDALQKDIPRSYIKCLNDRIEGLSGHLLSHQRRNAIIPTTAVVGQPHVTLPGRGQDLYLDLSFASRFTHLVFDVLSQVKPLSSIRNGSEDEVIMPDITQLDRSSVTPSIIRFLLNRYDRCIRPQYDIPMAGVLAYDGTGLKRLPGLFQFNVLMACAIAAAHEAYIVPSWRILAQICRSWANEFLIPVVSAANGESLAATLLLLVYELADPSRGITWELLDLAIRTCLQLGWHRNIACADIQYITTTGSTNQQHPFNSDEALLVTVLKNIEGLLRIIFNRPTMLSAITLPIASNVDAAYQFYAQISQALYCSGPAYDSHSCPFVGEVDLLMSSLERTQTQHPVVWQTWLLFLPTCVKHKQCVTCFQEVDEHNTRGMRTLRRSVTDAATQLINDVHGCATTKDGFVPPLIASSRAFMAGCTLGIAMSKRWIPPHLHTKELMKCTEILALFAPHWQGGHSYLSVWRIITELLDADLSQLV